jgi:hypothetical protein
MRLIGRGKRFEDKEFIFISFTSIPASDGKRFREVQRYPSLLPTYKQFTSPPWYYMVPLAPSTNLLEKKRGRE